MRSLTILYHHRTRSRDGQSVHIDEVVAALRSRGHRVIVVGPARRQASSTPLETRLLPCWLYELAEFGYGAVELVRMLVSAWRYHPDALYERANIYMLSGVCTAALLRLPYLLEVNSPLSEERALHGRLQFPRLARWTEHLCWNTASIVLPVTRVLAQTIEAAGVPPGRIEVIANAANPSCYSQVAGEAVRRTFGLADSPVLGFSGYVRDWHGLDRILDLLAGRAPLADTHLLVVGDGPAVPKLKSKALVLGIESRVHFAGTVGRTDMPSYIAAMDVALQPEVTPYASPLKLFEYMAARRAIVAPAAKNIMEVLSHGHNALLFAPGNMNAMGQALEALISDPDMRAKLAEAAADTITSRQMTWNGNAGRIADIIYRLRPLRNMEVSPA